MLTPQDRVLNGSQGRPNAPRRSCRGAYQGEASPDNPLVAQRLLIRPPGAVNLLPVRTSCRNRWRSPGFRATACRDGEAAPRPGRFMVEVSTRSLTVYKRCETRFQSAMFWHLLEVLARTLKLEVTQKDQKELARLLTRGVQLSCAPMALL